MVACSVANKKIVPSGRPQLYEEPLSAARQVSFTPTMAEELKARVNGNERKVSDLIRKAVDAYLHPKEPEPAPPPPPVVPETTRLLMIDTVSAGPFKEAVNRAQPVVVPNWLIDLLSLTPRDLLFEVDGESMAGAGIPDGSWVALRPVEKRVPGKREATLVEITNGEDYKSTLKHYHQGGIGQPPRLTDGEGEEVPIDEGYDARPVGVVRAVLTPYQP